jgi:uncharacterized protein YegJ (DUF2314 family)
MGRTMRLTSLAVAAVAACMIAGCERPAAAAATNDTPVVSVGPDDAEVNAAIAEARRNLPIFWKMLERRPAGVDSFALKIAFPTSGSGAEHIWIDVNSRSGDDIVGVINNDPEFRPDLKLGMTVHVKASQISDWQYRKDAMLYGHFTTRVLVKHMKADEAADTLKLLSPTPLEQRAG